MSKSGYTGGGEKASIRQVRRIYIGPSVGCVVCSLSIMCVSPKTTQQLPHTFFATAVAAAEQDSLDTAGQPALERLRKFKSFDSNVTSLSPSVNQNDTSHLEGALRARVNISKELSSSRVLQGYREVKRYCQWRSFDAPT